ncbi:10254_t:CDS:2 [Racocetra persica]|uniref:10254_t:CDS:1 n=1 Tax=Racocetra persica TaxID=160502 RepID=A0ACA9LSE9_9GLOM|nr:10254_t:CDS:2 [Racocetra persica]
MEKKYDNNITNTMLALLTAKSEDEINQLFDKIQEIEHLAAAHALSNRCGKNLKLMGAILHENDRKESSSINKLEYQERLLALKERELALREREAKVHSIELANLEKVQKLKSAS